jgi:hypothetical protein
MPTQFVKVSFPTDRLVYVDDEKCGRTNKTFRVNQGTHRFTLGPVTNYTPHAFNRNVTGTTQQRPLELEFERIEEA